MLFLRNLSGGPAAAGMVVTCGADWKLNVLDPRMSFALVHTVELTNFPYSLAVAGACTKCWM